MFRAAFKHPLMGKLHPPLKSLSTFRPPLKSFSTFQPIRLSPFKQFAPQKRFIQFKAAQTTKPIVGHWLYFNAGLIFAIVVVGGLTRLTESGLSITEWNVISGMKPPRSQEDWVEEFEKYKQFPEYKMYECVHVFVYVLN